MRVVVSLVALSATLLAGKALAQYAEVPQELPVSDCRYDTATQIGRRLYVGGCFRRVSPPTGGAVVVDADGNLIPGAFPRVTGTVHQVVADGLGGFLIVGDFGSVGGQSIARFARIAPDRTVDIRYRVDADGAIRFAALAHGHVYLAGDFTTINGVSRRGLAALEAVSGQLTNWARSFNPRGQYITALAVSSVGVYVSAWAQGSPGSLWGLDTASGAEFFERYVWVNAIAATSSRVFVGSYGYRRPVWAVNPYTGQDDPSWTIGLQFQYLSGTYGDYTSVAALLLDAGRLYLGGYFRTADGSFSLAAVDAATGAPSAWRPIEPTAQIRRLTRVGTAVVAHSGFLRAYDVTTGALQAFDPQAFGAVHSVAPAPDGVVVAGDFNGVGGVARRGLASIDLDTTTIEPWTVTLPQFAQVSALATDGAWVIAQTLDSRYFKIDPASGAIVAEHRVSTGDVILTNMRVAGGELITAVSERYESAEIGVISIADWSYQALPVTLSGGTGQYVMGLDVDGDAIYVTGDFAAINGVSRPFAGAVHRVTGAVLPWRPSPDARVNSLRASGGRVWMSGYFNRIGGKRRRGLGEVDGVTGQARAWNPDVPVGFYWGPRGGTMLWSGVVELGPHGVLYTKVDGLPRPTVSGQETLTTVAFSTATGQRLPWRPVQTEWVAVLPDCLLVQGGCLRRAVTAPTDLRVEQSGATITLRWTSPTDAPVRSAVSLEVGRSEGRSDLLTVTLPPDQTSYTATAPPGQYFARVRSHAGVDASMTTADVSFAVGPPDTPAAPLDVTAVTEGARLTIQWTPPSSGAPAGYVFEAGTEPGRRDVASLPLAGTATSVTIDAPVGRYWGRLVSVNGADRSTPSGELLVDIAATSPLCGGFAPLPPLELTATVAGRTVTLIWQQPEDGASAATQHIVAGTAPGVDDLGVIDVPGIATSYSTRVPPGIYYVRVFGANTCGASGWSNEVRVEVR